MAHRTFAVGDIHGDTLQLFRLLACLPELDRTDTLVFLGDYLDRGPHSAAVVAYLRGLSEQTPAQVVALRGNHEDAWLRVAAQGWDEFVLPPSNGCLAALRSYAGGPPPSDGELAQEEELVSLRTAAFFPEEDLRWLESLPYYYEDDHALYVHAGIPRGPTGFLHPEQVEPKSILLWCRDEDFFRNYRGKTVVFGHTHTEYLPPELSGYTPEDPSDLWAGENVVGLDTGCGSGGFLTGFELPLRRVYESRE
jgi:serine/threonine protein phosphatase 1